MHFIRTRDTHAHTHALKCVLAEPTDIWHLYNVAPLQMYFLTCFNEQIVFVWM